MSTNGQKSVATRPKRERNPEETRRRILDAAEQEFATRGYDGTRLRDVALGAGVHHALLHHYYGDKEGLFRAVLERAMGQLSTQTLNLLQEAHDVRQLTARLVDAVVDYYADHMNLVQILHFAQLDRSSPAYAACEEIAQSQLLPIIEGTRQALGMAQQAGILRDDIDPRRLVALAMGAAGYMFHERDFFSLLFGEDIRSEASREAHKKALTALLLEGALQKA